MRPEIREGYEIAEKRGFKCALCRKRPPDTWFNYELSGYLCSPCVAIVQIAVILIPFFVLMFICGLLGG